MEDTIRYGILTALRYIAWQLHRRRMLSPTNTRGLHALVSRCCFMLEQELESQVGVLVAETAQVLKEVSEFAGIGREIRGYMSDSPPDLERRFESRRTVGRMSAAEPRGARLIERAWRACRTVMLTSRSPLGEIHFRSFAWAEAMFSPTHAAHSVQKRLFLICPVYQQQANRLQHSLQSNATRVTNP